MANGEPYRHSVMSAASPIFRLGTKVLVVHKHKKAILTITDRMPARNHCVVLDLSGAAAAKLGIDGIGHVKVSVLSR